MKSSQAEELFCTNANTNPSGLELSVLGLEEVEGSVKAKTKPSGVELGFDCEDIDDSAIIVGGRVVTSELELAWRNANTNPSGSELAKDIPELADDPVEGYVIHVDVVPQAEEKHIFRY